MEDVPSGLTYEQGQAIIDLLGASELWLGRVAVLLCLIWATLFYQRFVVSLSRPLQ